MCAAKLDISIKNLAYKDRLIRSELQTLKYIFRPKGAIQIRYYYYYY